MCCGGVAQVDGGAFFSPCASGRGRGEGQESRERWCAAPRGAGPALLSAAVSRGKPAEGSAGPARRRPGAMVGPGPGAGPARCEPRRSSRVSPGPGRAPNASPARQRCGSPAPGCPRGCPWETPTGQANSPHTRYSVPSPCGCALLSLQSACL